MTPQDWEDMAILQDAAINIAKYLKEVTTNGIHCFSDNTDGIKECGSKLIRIAFLTNKLYNGESLTEDDKDEGL